MTQLTGMHVKGFERPKSLTELVAQEIRDRIVSGDLQLGQALSELKMSRELDVSRTPVREAFNRLETEGLVTVERQRGTFVFTLSKDDLARICDVRTCLEVAALEYAIDRNPGALQKALAESVARMSLARKEADTATYLSEDTRFHQYFFDFADNRFLNDAYQAIALKMAALRNMLGDHPDHMSKSFAEHKAIVDAVRDGNFPTAAAILRTHIDRKEGSYWKLATLDGSKEKRASR
jgi:DNA-binding GntR family transcriptional regulator